MPKRRSPNAEQLTGAVAYHGEGPVWSEHWGGLRWLDMLAGDILTLRADGTVSRRHVASVVACVRPRRDGGAVLGVERGFALESPDGAVSAMDDLWADGFRMNEGGCDPDGRFYCGSLAYDGRASAAGLYRLDPDGTVRLVLDGVSISNGLDWSPDGTRAYYNDTATGRTDVFDYDPEAGLTGRRTFVELDGAPDGLTIDAEGGVWIAVADGGHVRRYAPDGSLARSAARGSTNSSSPPPARASAPPRSPWPDRCSSPSRACAASPSESSPADRRAARGLMEIHARHASQPHTTTRGAHT
jgi:sugar lactone lactonase YvrE